MSSISAGSSSGAGGSGQQSGTAAAAVVCVNCVAPAGPVHLQCVEQQCNKAVPVTLCIRCFAMGASPGGHSREHGYQVKCVGGVPMFGVSNCTASGWTSSTRHPWTSDEEVKLLNAVTQCNMGSWEEVAAQLKTKRSPEDVRQHYESYYVDGLIGQASTRGMQLAWLDDQSADVDVPEPLPTHPPADFAGRPQRPQEWHDSAERDLNDLHLFEDDAEIDKEVKCALLSTYLDVVRHRYRLKRLSHEYNLLSRPAVSLHSMKTFTQFTKPSELENVIRGMEREERLRHRIELLQYYRRNDAANLNVSKDMCSWATCAAPPPPARSKGAIKAPTPSTSAASEVSVASGKQPESSAKSSRPQPTPTKSSSDRLSASELELMQTSFGAGDSAEEYMLVKLAVLGEALHRQHGLSVRTNVKPDAVALKHSLLPFMTDAGWLNQ